MMLYHANNTHTDGLEYFIQSVFYFLTPLFLENFREGKVKGREVKKIMGIIFMNF